MLEKCVLKQCRRALRLHTVSCRNELSLHFFIIRYSQLSPCFYRMQHSIPEPPITRLRYCHLGPFANLYKVQICGFKKIPPNHLPFPSCSMHFGVPPSKVDIYIMVIFTCCCGSLIKSSHKCNAFCRITEELA